MRVVFDRFTFDTDRRELLDGSDAVHIGPKAFQLLEILIANRPRPIRKEELYESIWADAIVDESNLAGLIKELRSALGDDAREPRFIRTVHGFGYAFCGDIAAPAAFIIFKDRQLPLREGSNVLGRDPSADVQIDDSTVSRKHASIEVRGELATLQDLESKNGTFLDGEKISAPTPLQEGQTIVLGDAAMVFRRSAFASTLTVAR
jgi:DNA-binding winged helix-turn-helix (wHTH) protein